MTDAIVLDTNVIIAALLSRQGASYKPFTLIGTGLFEICLSVTLVVEYEDAAKRLMGTKIILSAQQIDDTLDYLCSVGQHHEIYFLWRPQLKDPRDDMVLELAVSAGAKYILTYNLRDFTGIERFGIIAMTPKSFLEQLGAIP